LASLHLACTLALRSLVSCSSADLAHTGLAKVANSDALALSVYLQGLGFNIDADRVNKLLVLLAVLVIECGGGLALAVGMALSDKGMSAQPVRRGATHPIMTSSIEMRAIAAEESRVRTVHSSRQTSRARILAMVRDANGVLRTGHRALADSLGISPTRAGQLLRDLAIGGVIRVRTSKMGSVITFAQSPALRCQS
jgi:hypothetical protein